MTRSIGPITVRDDKGVVIAHLYQNLETHLWTAYNKQPNTTWRRFGPATRKECRTWIDAQKAE